MHDIGARMSLYVLRPGSSEHPTRPRWTAAWRAAAAGAASPFLQRLDRSLTNGVDYFPAEATVRVQFVPGYVDSVWAVRVGPDTVGAACRGLT